jgi:hypothetical protein
MALAQRDEEKRLKLRGMRAIFVLAFARHQDSHIKGTRAMGLLSYATFMNQPSRLH